MQQIGQQTAKEATGKVLYRNSDRSYLPHLANLPHRRRDQIGTGLFNGINR